MWAKQKAFTIVEILVVITVISILAAITVVAYNGVQDRAYVTKVNAIGSQFARAIAAYQAANGAYPAQGLGSGYCLGKPTDYPAQDGYVASSCIRPSSGTDAADLFVNSQLDTFVSGPNAANVKPVLWADAGEYERGYIYFTSTNQYGWYATIRWYFTGVKSCGSGASFESLDNGATTGCYIRLGPTT